MAKSESIMSNTNGERPGAKRARAERRQAAKRRQWLIYAAIGSAFVGVIAFMTLWPQVSAPAVAAERLNDHPRLGAADTPVQIVEFADFGCPSCRAWHRAGILDQIMAQYGDRISFTWRDFAVITPQSPKAAEAGQCAHDQGRFWAYHDYLYEQAGSLSVSMLKEYAAAIGLDASAFATCLDSGKYGRMVDAGIQEARRVGARGTPSFVVNGQLLAGPPSYDMLATIIESALARPSQP